MEFASFGILKWERKNCFGLSFPTVKIHTKFCLPIKSQAVGIKNSKCAVKDPFFFNLSYSFIYSAQFLTCNVHNTYISINYYKFSWMFWNINLFFLYITHLSIISAFFGERERNYQDCNTYLSNCYIQKLKKSLPGTASLKCSKSGVVIKTSCNIFEAGNSQEKFCNFFSMKDWCNQKNSISQSRWCFFLFVCSSFTF